MSGPNQRLDLSICGAGRLRVAINCGVLSANLFLNIWFLGTFMPLLSKTQNIQNNSLVKGLRLFEVPQELLLFSYLSVSRLSIYFSEDFRLLLDTWAYENI